LAEISAIFFDVGGVLLTNGWDHVERSAVLGHFAVDRAAYESRHELANDAWEKGFMTAEQFLQRTVFFEPRSFTPVEFLDEVKAQSRLLDSGAIGILGELRASERLKLMVLNNESRELNDYRIERFQLHRYFDGFLSSCYLGMRKPDPKMFSLALQVIQRPPGETAFVDDRQENCDAAQSVGIHAIRYQNPAQFAKDLDRLGVEF
jgi:putative hydrolase of the HAD superfamily